jgi:hypothetical protein
MIGLEIGPRKSTKENSNACDGVLFLVVGQSAIQPKEKGHSWTMQERTNKVPI